MPFTPPLSFLDLKKNPFSFRQTWQQKHVPVQDVCPAPTGYVLL